MIRIYSIQQALSLKGIIPKLAVIRSIQFMGDGYSPERDGHIIVIQKGDSLAQALVSLKKAEFIEDDHIVFEVVVQIDNSKTVAYILPFGVLVWRHKIRLLHIFQRHFPGTSIV